MDKKSFIEYELNSIKKINKYQLPNRFKKVGYAIFAISFILMFVVAFTSNNDALRQATKYGILVGLLITSVSKDKIEDEFITKLRMQSYSFAFVMGVFYALALPFADYIVDLLFHNNDASIKDIGDFNILWMLLFVQVFFFEYLKRIHK